MEACSRCGLGYRVAHFRPEKTAHDWRTAVAADGKGYPDLAMAKPGQLTSSSARAPPAASPVNSAHGSPSSPAPKFMFGKRARPRRRTSPTSSRTPAT